MSSQPPPLELTRYYHRASITLLQCYSIKFQSRNFICSTIYVYLSVRVVLCKGNWSFFYAISRCHRHKHWLSDFSAIMAALPLKIDWRHRGHQYSTSIQASALWFTSYLILFYFLAPLTWARAWPSLLCCFLFIYAFEDVDERVVICLGTAITRKSTRKRGFEESKEAFLTLK